MGLMEAFAHMRQVPDTHMLVRTALVENKTGLSVHINMLIYISDLA